MPSKIVFRPNGKPDKNNFSIVFKGGFVGCFHYETKALICLFKTSYGSILSLEYSKDGKILAFGCEDDNIYIVDSEKNLLIFSLQGHENYVSSLCFTDKYEEIEIEKKKVSSNNVISDMNSTNLNSKKIEERVEYNELIENIYSTDLISEPLSVNHFKKVRNSRIVSNKAVNIYSDVNTINTYYLFSGSYDGSIALWQIEHSHEKEYINTNNYLKSDTQQTIKLDSYIKIVSLDFSKENIIRPTSLIQACPLQIEEIVVIDNLLFYIAKTNHSYKDILFRLFFSKKV